MSCKVGVQKFMWREASGNKLEGSGATGRGWLVEGRTQLWPLPGKKGDPGLERGSFFPH